MKESLYEREEKNMEKSRVTEYMICYIRKNRISKEWISEKTGIPKQKLQQNYEEPLGADEFLRLCVVLNLTPEKIASDLRQGKYE